MTQTQLKSLKVINVPKDFSPFPAGRFVSDGPNSGERFRDALLYPALQEARNVQIVLDGSEGYGSSFLEEAFGGLVRIKGMNPEEILTRIDFISKADPSLVTEITEYVRSAATAKR